MPHRPPTPHDPHTRSPTPPNHSSCTIALSLPGTVSATAKCAFMSRDPAPASQVSKTSTRAATDTCQSGLRRAALARRVDIIAIEAAEVRAADAAADAADAMGAGAGVCSKRLQRMYHSQITRNWFHFGDL